ncbi:MAG: hypothetical protein HYV26_04530 [Candidatus Hydrogenedentes bacterium]|nr:hypothetical protein [Candidatus Hydrogenedentota bacterium]
MYYGEHSASLDDKGRINIPVLFRQVMDVKNHEVWFMTRGYDGAVFMFDAAKWDSLLGELAEGATLDPRMMDFRRLLIGSGTKVKRDNQGRMVVPQHLREYAALGDEGVLLGVGDHIQLWSKEGWRQFQKCQMEEYKAMAAQLFGRSPAVAAQHEGGSGNAAH